jgi:hypothetical protein
MRDRTGHIDHDDAELPDTLPTNVYDGYDAVDFEERLEARLSRKAIAVDYIRQSWRFTTRNLTSFIAVGSLWTALFFLLEYLAFVSFDHGIANHQVLLHPFHFDPSHPTAAAAASAAAANGANTGLLTGQHIPSDAAGTSATTALTSRPDATHIDWSTYFIALFALRVFVYYPGLASYYVAVFNGIRRKNGLIYVGDFAAGFRWPDMASFSTLGVISFIVFYVAAGPVVFTPWLHLCTVVLFATYHWLATFSLPLLVDQPQLGIFRSLMVSMRVVWNNGSQVAFLLVLLLAMQIMGAAALLLGLLIAFPVAMTSICFAFDDLIGIDANGGAAAFGCTTPYGTDDMDGMSYNDDLSDGDAEYGHHGHDDDADDGENVTGVFRDDTPTQHNKDADALYYDIHTGRNVQRPFSSHNDQL